MALTAAIRNVVFALLTMLVTLPAAQPLLDFLESAGIVVTEAGLMAVAGVVALFVAGLITYVINKVGSRWSWINMIMSLGRAKTGAVYIPTNQEEVTAITTPPGERTIVTATNSVGATSPVTV